MSFVQETAWSSATITGNTATTTVVPTFSGGGAELVIVPLIVDNGNGCTGAHFSAHANLTLGASYVGTSSGGVIPIVLWGTWNGAASSPSLIVNYEGGNSGANGGKIQNAVFTGYLPQIITFPGPSQPGIGSSTSPSVVVTGVQATALVVAVGNSAGQNFTAGTGYTLAFNTSPWSGNITALEYTTGLSEAGGNPTVGWSLGVGVTWNMLAVAFPGTQTAPLPPFTQTQFFDQSSIVQT